MTIRLLLFAALCGIPLFAANPNSPQEAIDEVVVPRKTTIFLELQRSINSKTAQTGDKFSAIVQVPVTVDDKIVIPVGAFVIGHIDSASGAGYLKGKGSLLLGFDTLILPDGTTRHFEAVVETADSYSAGLQSEKGEITAPGEAGKEVGVESAKGAAKGTAAGAVVGVFRGETLRGMGTGALAGAAGGAVVGLFKKGEDVNLPQGSSLSIQIQEPVRFVKPTSKVK